MDLELKGRRALVTGSTAGIGFATAKALAAEGARLTVNGRTQARVTAAITYVCSDRASATAGAALRVDGGVVRSIA